MKPTKLRRQIAWEAARLLYERSEAEYYRAKLKAARRIAQRWVKPADLPSNVEIRDQVEALARQYEGDRRAENLRDMRLEALRLMRLLGRFRPRLVGSVLTGHIRAGSDIDLHLFADRVEAVARVLDQEGARYDVQRKQIRKFGEVRVYMHIHLRDRYPVELTIYPADRTHYVPRCSITGAAMARATAAELEALLARQYVDLDLPEAMAEVGQRVDRFQVYESLLLPLEKVGQSRRYHPEGDALYHSLQVFERARAELPYDEEFLLAALLHDVGKAIEPGDHIGAALEALDGFVTERTAWLVRHHMLAHALRDGTLGLRARRRLRRSEDYEELLLLAVCDRAGREAGVDVPELDEALDYIRNLAETFG